MKKKLIAIAAILTIACATLSGCNKQMIDMSYNFNYAIIDLNNGTYVEGKVQSWTDFEEGDQIQVKIDGTTYLVHSSNITLMHKKG